MLGIVIIFNQKHFNKVLLEIFYSEGTEAHRFATKSSRAGIEPGRMASPMLLSNV